MPNFRDVTAIVKTGCSRTHIQSFDRLEGANKPSATEDPRQPCNRELTATV